MSNRFEKNETVYIERNAFLNTIFFLTLIEEITQFRLNNNDSLLKYV